MTSTAMNRRADGARAGRHHADRLRGLCDTHVTVTTGEGSVTGSVLSCTRSSVWLIADDVDHVIPLDEILDVVVHDLVAEGV